tara:strand:+ start:2107 stop:2580 length:474 start_codon:yes stop_codon:yes gene_type:complete
MAGEIGLVLQNVVTRIDSITCDTVYDGTTGFRRMPHVYVPEDLIDAPTRGYALLYDAELEEGTTQGQATTWVNVGSTCTLFFAYGQSGDALGLQKVLAEDIDRVRYELNRINSDAYEQSTTSMYERDVTEVQIDSQPGVGGTTLITVEVAFRYRPSF